LHSEWIIYVCPQIRTTSKNNLGINKVWTN